MHEVDVYHGVITKKDNELPNIFLFVLLLAISLALVLTFGVGVEVLGKRVVPLNFHYLIFCNCTAQE